MKPMSARDPFRVGLVTIAAGLLLVLLVVAISVVPFGKKTYTAMLEQTAGLKAGEAVQVSGVPVGKVRSIAIDSDHVKITFTVSRDIHLGPQTTAAVKVATLLGTHLLAVQPKGSGDLANDTVPLAHTSVPFNLQDVLEQGNRQVGELDPKLLAQMLTTMTNQLGPSSKDLAPALEGVTRLSALITARSGQIGQLLTAARSVSDQLSRSSGDLVDLMKQTNLVVSEVTARRQAIHTLLVEATRLSVNLDAVIDQTKGDVKPALTSMNQVLATLHGQDKMLSHVLDVMAPSVRYLANAAGNGPYVDLYLKGPAIPPDDVKCKLGGCG